MVSFAPLPSLSDLNASFAEYEAEAWETGTRHSDETGYDSKPQSRRPPRSREESPHTYQQASQSGDYYRDTNLTYNNTSNPNLRLGGSQLSHSNLSHQQATSQHSAAPQLPFMPFAGGPGSVAGSDYGQMPMMMPQMNYQNTGSMYGMMPPGMPMNPMGQSMNMFGGSNGSHTGGFAPPSAPGLGGQQRPMSNFSLATTVNPFAGPSTSTNPSDDELFNALRNYLSTQDLMTVTKKYVFLFYCSFDQLTYMICVERLERRLWLVSPRRTSLPEKNF